MGCCCFKSKSPEVSKDVHDNVAYDPDEDIKTPASRVVTPSPPPPDSVSQPDSEITLNADWYFGQISRAEAETLLLGEGNTHGSFLVRESETKGDYILAILRHKDDDDDDDDEKDVKFYRIRVNDESRFYISEDEVFSGVEELVDHYTKKKGKLCSKLANACVKKVDLERKKSVSSEEAIIEPEADEDAPPAEIKFVVIVKHAYKAREEDDLSIDVGETLGIVDDSISSWWLAQRPSSSERGYIPSQYVCKENSLESKEWFFGNVSAVEAVNLLLLDENGPNSFLVRYSESDTGNFTISVQENEDGDRKVKHVKVQQDVNEELYVTKKSHFKSLADLVENYMEGKDKALKLGDPCVKQQPVMIDLSHKTEDEWEISEKDIFYNKDNKEDRLGEGNFGQVFKGKWKMKVTVAIKKPKSFSDLDEKEAQIMKKLKHDSIVRLYGVCSSKDDFMIVTEFMENGSLQKYLEDQSENLDLKVLVHFAAQIASGMAYLEKEQYVHRDLAARNVLVGKNNICKVADFGMARAMGNEMLYSTGSTDDKIPIRWTAPEALSGDFTVKSDVWSYGIVMYELFTSGAMPYKGMKNKKVKKELESGYRLPRPGSCPADIYEVMKKCWDDDLDERCSFKELCFIMSNYDLYKVIVETYDTCKIIVDMANYMYTEVTEL